MTKVRTQDNIFSDLDGLAERLRRLERAFVGGGGGGGAQYDSAPIGMVSAWTSTTIPTDYLLCNGQVVSEADYPTLATFAAAQVAAGNTLWAISGVAPNRSITVPDMRDRFIYGAGAKAMGVKGGAETHTLGITEMPSHNHGGVTGTDSPDHTHAAAFGNSQVIVVTAGGDTWISNHVSPYYSTGGASARHTHTIGAQGGGTAHNNMPPYVILAWVVKARGASVSGGVLRGDPGPKGDAADPTPLDIWHTVGDATTGLGTVFAAGWSNLGGTGSVQFRKDPFGRVWVRGFPTKSSAPALGEAIFTLPIGYRPPASTYFATWTNGTPNVGEVYVQSTGQVTVYNPVAGLTGLSLSGINFEADEVTTFPVGPRGVAGPPGASSYLLPPARIASTGNIDVTLAPASFDGVVPAIGDTILVWQQTAAVQNGLYTWNGASVAMTRLTANSSGTVLVQGMRCYVAEGTLFGNQEFFLKVGATVGTNGLLFTPSRGSVLHEAEQWGLAATYHNLTAVGTWYDLTRDGATGAVGATPYSISFTPPVDCWWEVDGTVYFYQANAAYTYCYASIALNVADADGAGDHQEITSGLHSGVIIYQTRSVKKKFKLTAGVAYTARLRAYTANTALQVYRGGNSDGTYFRSVARVR